ncbi:formyltransferase family protein [Embleya sp. NPDC059237]|uniref:formyltransferase family protein n=1 Tax=Embleya sp. NPDC059237 TaxID=3346784 RepID=UPI0036808AEF
MITERPCVRVALASARLDILDMMRQACAGSGFTPVLVVVPPMIWRHRTREPDPAARLARIRGVTPPEIDVVARPANELPEALHGARVDMLIVCEYSTTLPRFVLDAIPGGTIHCHPSLLPRWQGPLPVAWALRTGDPTIGLSVHRINGDTYDDGPVLAQGSISAPDDDFDPDALRTRLLHTLLRGVLPQALNAVARGEPGVPQDPAHATWAGFMNEVDRYLDLGQSALTLHHLTRALRYLGWTPHVRIDNAWHTITRTSLTATPTCHRGVDCGDGARLWVAGATPVPTRAHPRIYR